MAAGIWLLRSRLTSRGFDWRVFRATLYALQWGWLGGACAAVLAGYFGRALRWRVLMRPVKAHPDLWNLFSATVITNVQFCVNLSTAMDRQYNHGIDNN